MRRLIKIFRAENKREQLNQLLQDSWAALEMMNNILTTHLLKRNERFRWKKPLRIEMLIYNRYQHQIQYTALGHLHRFQNVGGHLSPVVYLSSPLSYSFRKRDRKKVVLIEAKPMRR
jgi:exonuclease SbcD